MNTPNKVYYIGLALIIIALPCLLLNIYLGLTVYIIGLVIAECISLYYTWKHYRLLKSLLKDIDEMKRLVNEAEKNAAN